MKWSSLFFRTLPTWLTAASRTGVVAGPGKETVRERATQLHSAICLV